MMVSKQKCKTMIDFLLSFNHWYYESGSTFSEENMNNLFSPEDAGKDIAIPAAVSLCCLLPGEKEDQMGDFNDRLQVPKWVKRMIFRMYEYEF